MEIVQLKRIIEAAILAAGQPLSLIALNELFGDDNPPGVDNIHAAIELLQLDYAEHGVALVEVASGWRFQVRPDVQSWVSKLWTERQTRYTRALLETLALIAYRQPVTRAEIEQIRGVAVSSNIIKTLEEREWVRVLGHRDVPGKPALFGTTRQFLDYFGLKNLDQLPPLVELRDVSDLEPQLQLDSAFSAKSSTDATHPTALTASLEVISVRIGEEETEAVTAASNVEAITDEQDPDHESIESGFSSDNEQIAGTGENP